MISYVFFHKCLQERADIRDEENAKPLKFDGGKIEFENVQFRWLFLSLYYFPCNGAHPLKRIYLLSDFFFIS